MKVYHVVDNGVIVNKIVCDDPDFAEALGAVLVPEGTELANEPTTEEILLELAADHEYRLSLQEMGLSESDLL